MRESTAGSLQPPFPKHHVNRAGTAVALVCGADRGDFGGVRAGRQPIEQLGPDRPAPAAALAMIGKTMIAVRPRFARDHQQHTGSHGTRLRKAGHQPGVGGVDPQPVKIDLGIGRNQALRQAKATRRPLYVLFVREQSVITGEDRRRKWKEDAEATKIFEHAKAEAGGEIAVLPCYAVSDSPVDTIIDVAATVGASLLILGAPQRSGLIHLLRGNIIRQVSDSLPDDIDLLVYA